MVHILPIRPPMTLGIYESSTMSSKANCLGTWSFSYDSEQLFFDEGGWEVFRVSGSENRGLVELST